MNGMLINTTDGSILKPYNHVVLFHEIHHIQIVYNHSKHTMNNVFGIYRSSVKKMSEEHMRNRIMNGVKIKLPTIVMIEIGRPHAIKMGKAHNVTNNCTYR